MAEIFRTRDCVVHFKGDAYPVAISPTLISNGWSGCQGVRWVDSVEDEFMVTISDGLYGGFLLWGSDEVSDQYTGVTGNQLEQGYGIFCAGGWLLSTSTYEMYTYNSRLAPPLVPITYVVGERLRWSNRGLLTKEDEWTLSGDPRAPNNFFIAYVVQVPRAENNNYIVVQMSI